MRGSFSRRLALLLTTVLASIVAAITLITFRRLEDAVAGAARARIEATSYQVANLLGAQARRLQREAARMAQSAELQRVLLPGAGIADSIALHRALDEEQRRSTQYASLALWDRRGNLVAHHGSLRIAGRNHPAGFAGDSVPTGGSPLVRVGALRSVDDTVSYVLLAPVLAPNRDTIGTYVATRNIGSGGEIGLLGGIIGPETALALGSPATETWSNLSRIPIAPPPVIPLQDSVFQFTNARAEDRLAATTWITGTPWVVMVDMAHATALAPARRLLLDLVGAALLLVAVAGGVTWFIVRRSLRPLEDVTRAAEDLAAGDYSRRVAVHRDDELGSLALSFNAMAAQVGDAAREIGARAEMLEQSNRELHESELRYRQLIEHSPDGLLVHRDGTIIFGNPAAAVLLGAAHSTDLEGRLILDFVGEADRDEMRRRIETVQRGEGSVSLLELCLARADGATLTVETTEMMLLLDGERAVQSILRDVTARKQLEEQFRQSQKMEAIGRLAGGIAHDFNNLLTVIQAYSDFALTGLEPDDPRRADVLEIRKAAQSAAQLTRQLLAFGRKQVLEPQYLDVNAAITGTLRMLERLIGDDVEVVTALGRNLAGIWADPGQVQQAILNLAVNARDAMPDGGMLQIRTANMTLRDTLADAGGDGQIPPGEYVVLAVHDTGIGMTPEVLAKAFEPFFTTKQVGQGTGLGLSTVHGIVRQSGGYIHARSTPDRGTTVSLYFPAHESMRLEPGLRVSGEHRAPIGGRVLVVEDEPAVRGAIQRALERSGYVVDVAEDTTNALALLEQRADGPDLIITDMVMPGRSGAELLREAARTHPGVPSIILSGYAEEAVHHRWSLPPGAIFMQKPVSASDLTQKVREVITVSRTLQAAQAEEEPV